MKRFAIIALLLLALLFSAHAETLPLVVDGANLLTGEQADALSKKAEEISRKYMQDVVLLTAYDIGNSNPKAYAADYYDFNGYGQDAASSGVIFLLSMAQRDWAIVTTGYAISAVNDDTQSAIMDDVLPYFSDNEYYKGFERFLRDIDIALEQAQNGTPFGPGNRARFDTVFDRALTAGLISALGAIIVTVVVMLILKGQMRTARPKPNAVDYAREGSFVVEREGEIFLYRTQIRRPREDNSSKGGGSSSTFTSSSGTTHGGSSGKF